MSSGEQHNPTRIINWSEYNNALVKRGEITFWFSEEIDKVWFFHGDKTGRGSFKTYSDTAIQTCLMVKSVYRLTLRATEGFVNSLFKLMGNPLTAPDYSSLSKRAKSLQVEIPRRLSNKPVEVVFDSTGLKIYGEGEWKVRKHGVGKRRTWRKRHLAVNPDNGDCLGVQLTTVAVGDSEVLPDLLAQCQEQPIHNAYGDGAYDTRECYDVIHQRGGTAVVPPRDNAAYWEAGHPRNEAVSQCRKDSRAEWKKRVGYHRRSVAETAMYRYKQLIGATLAARLPETQGTEAYIGVAVLNRMNTLGMPVRG